MTRFSLRALLAASKPQSYQPGAQNIVAHTPSQPL